MWPKTALKQHCEQIVDCPHSTPVWTDSGVVVLRNQNIRFGRLDLSDPSFTDEEHYFQRIRRAKPQAGDLVITREAPMGEVCILPDGLQCCLGQRMVLLRPNLNRCDGRFLLYALQSSSVQHEIQINEGTGSTVSNLRIPLLEALPIPTPGLPEQRAIASILGALDDKIEVNRRMNQTLEEIARTIFTSWFVRFDPVRAKAEGRQPDGMDAETAALFPDSFVDSELGPIPVGWQIKTIGQLTSLTKGVSYRSADLQPSLTALVTLKSFARGGGYRPDGLKSFSGPYKAQQVVNPGELIVAMTDVTQAADVIGRPALVGKSPDFEQLVASLDVMIVRPLASGPPISFLFHLLETEAFHAHAYGHTSGTTVLHLGKAAIPAYVFASARESLFRTFDEIVSPLFDRVSANVTETNTLIELRDLLLPKLLSGELRVQEAETLAGRAG